MATAQSVTELAFHELLDTRAVRAVFQPLVDLATGHPVAYEALARGPEGSPLESPAALFPAAYRAGRAAELDWACRAAAFASALDVLDPASALFVNTEPVSVTTSCPPDLAGTVAAAEQRLRVVVEVTERAVAADPAGLLAATARARRAGWGVALDDVGAEPGSLAVMPFLDPDVIKLDLRLIQERTTPETARIVNAVRAQAERSGALVVAEGIERPVHEAVAITMGATLGQGWLYGRPGPLPGPGRTPGAARLTLRPGGPRPGPAGSPFGVVTGAGRATAVTTKELLLPMSVYLEDRALDADEPTVLLACFQDAVHFTPRTAARYASLAGRAPLTVAFGGGMPARPVPGVLGTALGRDDPLRSEWNVLVVGPHFAGGLVARDLGDTGPDRERRFAYAMTHDRDLVIEAARGLLAMADPA